MNATSSRELFAEAVKVMPGGVNSPVRAFGAVGGSPRFIARAVGARVWDVEGNSYIDYIGSWGPLILGHAHPGVVAAVCEAARRGVSFGAPTAAEVALAKMIIDRIPSIQMVRLVNSGTEATMTALRVARGFTRREKVIKFAGCYHGHSDAFLVKAGSGAATLGVPSSPGVPAAVAAETVGRRVQRPGRGAGGFREERGRSRRGHRRAGLRECRRDSAGAGFSGGPARAVHGPRRAADFRRSDDGIPRPARLGPGALWDCARPDDAGKDRRRRASHRRGRRAGGDHESACACGTGLPGRNALRKSGGRRGGDRDIERL